MDRKEIQIGSYKDGDDYVAWVQARRPGQEAPYFRMTERGKSARSAKKRLIKTLVMQIDRQNNQLGEAERTLMDKDDEIGRLRTTWTPPEDENPDGYVSPVSDAVIIPTPKGPFDFGREAAAERSPGDAPSIPLAEDLEVKE